MWLSGGLGGGGQSKTKSRFLTPASPEFGMTKSIFAAYFLFLHTSFCAAGTAEDGCPHTRPLTFPNLMRDCDRRFALLLRFCQRRSDVIEGR